MLQISRQFHAFETMKFVLKLGLVLGFVFVCAEVIFKELHSTNPLGFNVPVFNAPVFYVIKKKKYLKRTFRFSKKRSRKKLKVKHFRTQKSWT